MEYIDFDSEKSYLKTKKFTKTVIKTVKMEKFN